MLISRLFVYTIVFILALSPVYAQKKDIEKSKTAVKKGVEYYRLGRYNQAENIFNKILQIGTGPFCVCLGVRKDGQNTRGKGSPA